MILALFSKFIHKQGSHNVSPNSVANGTTVQERQVLMPELPITSAAFMMKGSTLCLVF